jgi:hypothetical protein
MGFVDQIFWVYPWDLTDENPLNRLSEIRRLGANAISIPFAHHSLRALAPHRRGNKVISISAALGFRPRPGEFPPSGIQAPHSEWATDQGPVADLASLAEKTGLRIKAWTVVLHSTPLASANPDSTVTNCFGDRFVHALCPSAPKSREYALRLVRAVCSRPIHAIELEAIGFYGYEHLSHHEKCGIAFDLFHHFLFSYCFCAHCTKAIASAGLDASCISEQFRTQVLAFFEGKVPPVRTAKHAGEELERLLGKDMATALLGVRSHCVLSLLQEIRELVPRSIELTVSSGLSIFEGSALFGAEPEQTLQIADLLQLVVFEPDEAAFRNRFETAIQCVNAVSRLISGIRIFPPDIKSEAGIESRLAFLQAKGFRAVQLYHYGLAPAHLLTATAKALEKLNGETRDPQN